MQDYDGKEKKDLMNAINCQKRTYGDEYYSDQNKRPNICYETDL